jgi:hypothetical protein
MARGSPLRTVSGVGENGVSDVSRGAISQKYNDSNKHI